MTRKQKIYETLEMMCQKIDFEKLKNGFLGFNATQISNVSGVIRNNVSKDLNILVKEKKLIKVKGHPVYFFCYSRLVELIGYELKLEDMEVDSIGAILFQKAVPHQEYEIDIFEQIIGAAMSLDLPIKQAKAAIFYPPHGLHSLLIGPTGSGKTTFAELMYQYALQTGTLKPDAEFIVFNCAEYADNPQLILSQLFGYAKGAFTGAVRDKAGLVERADGGVFLLDEVHRLPPEGQEMLFTLMDKQQYRRIGETGNSRSAEILFIAATTEDTESVLLRTFLRRIPMVIKMPSLQERSIEERYELIGNFFSIQARLIKTPIRVYRDVLKAFLLYECKGNIGQLKSDIQLVCARGFLEYKTQCKPLIELDTPLLPEHVYSGLLYNQKNREKIFTIIGNDSRAYYDFPQGQISCAFINDNDIGSDRVYFELAETYELYSNRGYARDKINRKMNAVIEKYLKKLLGKIESVESISENEKLFKIISPHVYKAVQDAMRIAADILKRPIEKKVIIALAMHIDALPKRKPENNNTRSESLKKIAVNNPLEYQAAKLVRKAIENILQIEIREVEEGFITMFLTAMHANHLEPHIGVLVIAHGKSTASSIADVCNSLLRTDQCKALDMALDENVEDIFDKAVDLVEEIDEGKGVLLLVDMGSLASFGKLMEERRGLQVETIQMVSTPMALEAVRKSLLPGMMLPQVVKELKESVEAVGQNCIVTEENHGIYEKMIVTLCMSSEGTAVKLAELIQRYVPSVAEHKILIQPMTIEKIKSLSTEQLDHICLFAGSLNPQIPYKAYISTDEIILDNGLDRIRNIIEGYQQIEMNEKKIPSLTMGIVEEALDFLNPQKAFFALEAALKGLVESLGIERTNHLKTVFYMHCSCMIERAIRKEALPYEGIREKISEYKDLYGHIRKAFESVEESFGMIIPDTEYGYLIDMIDTEKRT